MRSFYFTAGLLALSAGAAQADSLANAGRASTDSAVATGELTEAGVKLVAGAVAVPLIVGGASAAAPGSSLATAGAMSEWTESADGKAIMITGQILALPGGLAMTSGIALWKFSDEPLEVSSETVTGKPARTTKPDGSIKAEAAS